MYLKKQALHNIFPEKFELQFFQIFRSLKLLGCDYFYFLGESQSIFYRFCTHDNWINFYHDEKFILNDPLKRITEGTPFVVLPWGQVTYLNKNEKRTMLGRLSFGLFNGLSITRKYQERKYTLVFASELREHDLARYLLELLSNVVYGIRRPSYLIAQQPVLHP